MRESEHHLKLKDRAEVFLKRKGFKEIQTEYHTGVLFRGHYSSHNREAWVDVAGFNGDRIALVECGDTPEAKLRTLSRHFDEVYHLPYGGRIRRVKRTPKTKWWEIE